MARRRNREPDWSQVILGLGVALAAGWYMSPEFRVLVVGFGVFAVLAAVLWVGVLIVKGLLTRGPSLGALPITSYAGSGPVLPATPTTKEASHAAPLTLNRELISSLEWRRFEILVTLYFHKAGYDPKRTRTGADGGVDIELYRHGESQPFAVVQCKAWNSYKVGVKPVRELYGVMAAQGVPLGYFVTSGDFTTEALEFAAGKKLTLVSGSYLLKKLGELPPDARAFILSEVTEGDYTTPTCPRCDTKMVMRKGPNGGFWGCRAFPYCKSTFRVGKLDQNNFK